MMIRAATTTDLDTIIQLYINGWQDSYANLIDADFLAAMADNPRSRDYLANLLHSGRTDAVVYLAEDGPQTIGFVAGGMTRDMIDRDTAEIYAIYVARDAQHRKIGQQLFDACCAQLRRRQFTKLHVWTFAANTKARDAYRRWGGTLASTTRLVSVANNQLEEVKFEWDLGTRD